MVRPLLPLLFLVLTGTIPAAKAEQCQGMTASLQETAREACLIECETYYQENPDARPVSTQETCRSFFEGISRRNSGESNENLAAACDKGVWNGILSFPERVKAYQILVQDLGHYLQQRVADRQKFLDGCDKDLSCRRQLGRSLDLYRGRKADGTYETPDATVDARVRDMDIMQLLTTSEQNRWANQRRCLDHFAELSTTLVPESGEWTFKQETQRYEQMLTWDPDCATLMPLEKPSPDFDKPRPKKSFLDSLGIKPQCYPQAKVTELVCLEVAKFVTDPLWLLPAGGVAAKMLTAAGMKIAAKTIPKVASVLARSATTTGSEVAAATDGALAKTVAGSVFKSKDEFITQFATKKLSTTEDQKYFFDLATSTKPKGDVAFYRFEGAQQKRLNTLFNNNKMVDAINNREFSQIKDGLEVLKKEYPNLKITVSGADWKALDVAVEGKVPPGFNTRLDEIFKNASAQTEADLKRLGILPKGESVKQWYFAGYDEKSADLADMATRVNRTLDSNPGMRSFSDPVIQKNVKSYVEQAEVFRAKLQDTMATKGLMQDVPGTDKMIPTRDVLELVRKEPDPEKLRATINATLETNLTKTDVADLQSYALAVDTVQPRIYAYSRQFASLDEAVNGGISLDQKAMGAANLEATAKALAQSDKGSAVVTESGEMAGSKSDDFIVVDKAFTSNASLEETVENIRASEKAVTATFKKDMEQNNKIIREFLEKKKGMSDVKITCSGDDCVAAVPKAMDAKTKSDLIKRFSATDNPSGRRISFVGNDIKSNMDRGMLTSHGESVEKKLRSELVGKIPKSTLDKLTFGVDMQGKAAGEGGVRLLIGNSQVRLRPGDFKLINDAFKKSVQSVNQTASEQLKRATNYQVLP